MRLKLLVCFDRRQAHTYGINPDKGAFMRTDERPS
jgi:hypothetical protein